MAKLRIPTIASLKRMDEEHALQIHNLLEESDNPENAMVDVNDLLGWNGVEYLEGKYAYVNADDSYDTTLIYDMEDDRYFVGNVGDLLEEGDGECRGCGVVVSQKDEGICDSCRYCEDHKQYYPWHEGCRACAIVEVLGDMLREARANRSNAVRRGFTYTSDLPGNVTDEQASLARSLTLIDVHGTELIKVKRGADDVTDKYDDEWETETVESLTQAFDRDVVWELVKALENADSIEIDPTSGVTVGYEKESPPTPTFAEVVEKHGWPRPLYPIPPPEFVEAMLRGIAQEYTGTVIALSFEIAWFVLYDGKAEDGMKMEGPFEGASTMIAIPDFDKPILGMMHLHPQGSYALPSDADMRSEIGHLVKSPADYLVSAIIGDDPANPFRGPVLNVRTILKSSLPKGFLAMARDLIMRR